MKYILESRCFHVIETETNWCKVLKMKHDIIEAISRMRFFNMDISTLYNIPQMVDVRTQNSQFKFDMPPVWNTQNLGNKFK